MIHETDIDNNNPDPIGAIPADALLRRMKNIVDDHVRAMKDPLERGDVESAKLVLADLEAKSAAVAAAGRGGGPPVRAQGPPMLALPPQLAPAPAQVAAVAPAGAPPAGPRPATPPTGFPGPSN